MAANPQILDEFGRPYVRESSDNRPGRRLAGYGGISSRYDAAQSTNENRAHWQFADALSARRANNLGVRRTLRNRSRYEQANNGYCGGLVKTLADDLIGTGPRLQGQEDDDALNETVELRWHEWAEIVEFVQKLHTGKRAKVGDGEMVGVLTNAGADEPRLENYPVRLDVWEIECDQLTTPPQAIPTDYVHWVDGIELTPAGRPKFYHILKVHPGDLASAYTIADYESLPARNVVHWFRRDRPNQARGIPEITPGLPLCAMKRRWTLATLLAAEVAADFAVLLTTQASGDTQTQPPDPFETLDIDRGLMTALPVGVDAKQMRSEHPGAQYSAFKAELLREFGRPVSAPYNVVSGSSAEYNYSSARMDRQLYNAAMKVERESCRKVVLDPTFEAWYAEAILIPGYLPPNAPPRFRHGWHWPGFEAVDPLKEALADTERLEQGTTTLQELANEKGQDWLVIATQRAREFKKFKELGLPIPAWMDPAAGKTASVGSVASDNATRDVTQKLTRKQLIALAMDDDWLNGHANGHALNGGHN